MTALRRVAITGLGVVSAVGRGKTAFWEALLSGKSGAAPVKSFSTEAYRTHLGCEVKDAVERGAVAFALDAARQALADASAPSPWRAGIALGTTLGDSAFIEQALARAARGSSPAELMREAFPHFPGAIPAAVARELGLSGPNAMLTSACAAGNFALAHAFEQIARGRIDAMLAGGVDVFNEITYAGFNRLLAVAPERCAPFSKGRRGLIPAEGCAILVLEEWERAVDRGARIYAEMLGYGMSSDAFHVTMPDLDGVVRALEACLEDSGLKPGDVDYISAHGTGTSANDKTETAAIKRVFGVAAAKIPVSSIKAVLGHGMGAATALEAAACALALETGLLPPTANFTPGDADCDLDYVAEGPRRADPRVILSNGFAFGGANAVIALAKPGRPPAAASPAALPRLVITGMAMTRDPQPLALAEALLPDKDLRFMDKPMAYALIAARQALQDARLGTSGPQPGVGLVLESSGELESQLRFETDLVTLGPSGVEPMLFPSILANAAASRTAILLGLKLINKSLAGSFPGGETALAAACDFLSRRGRGIVLAGGVWAAPGPAPGLPALPEGGIIFVVETREGALARGARIYAEIGSWEESFDPAGRAEAAPDGLWEAVRRAAAGARVRHEARGLWGGRISISLSP
ncbi:MAG: beta-ketoacyl-[acyl-carrier-protein] synthase family protein [Elusimicrobia bacterium]|nr:beta-ketoacyl-[acyl-carrier-protein] synthase family protein [Elusimicrobiota bacterium]